MVPCYLFLSINISFIILAVSRRQTFCNCSTGLSTTITFIFHLIPSDTVPKNPTILGSFFRLHLSYPSYFVPKRVVFIYLFTFLLAYLRVKEERSINYVAHVVHLINHHPLAFDPVGLGIPGGFWQSLTLPLFAACSHTMSCLSQNFQRSTRITLSFCHNM